MASALTPAFAQQNRSASTSSGDEEAMTARGLFVTNSADAMKIQVEDVRTGELVYANQIFKQGDALKVFLSSNFEGYVYILNVERRANGQERRFLLFPSAKEVNNKISAHSPCELPPGKQLEFDENPGIEVLQVIISREPVTFLDNMLKGSGCLKDENPCELGKAAATLAAQLTGDVASSPKESKGGIVPKKSSSELGPGSIRSRDIILSPGKDKEKSAYVAVPESGNSLGRLKSREVMVFEIRLEHKGQ
jgi:hypothetical protein